MILLQLIIRKAKPTKILLIPALLTLAVIKAALPSLAEENISFPFEGIVTADNVNVRSGPDIIYYPVIRLMKGNKVEVVGEETGWLKIIPPKGTFSLVAKEDVELINDNKCLTKKEKTPIRAGSVLTDNFRSIQMLAPKGMELTIIGTYDKFYKVLPPKGAYLWISSQYIRPILSPKTEREKIEEKGPASSQPTQEAALPTTQKAEEKETPEPLKEIEKNIFGQFKEKIENLDKLYEEELKKPLLLRDLSKLREEYQKIANQNDNLLASVYARRRLEIIDYQIEAQKNANELRELLKRLEQGSKVIEERLADSELKMAVVPKLYQAEGILKQSNVFSGPLMAKRYRLIDPKQNKTIAYVEIADKKIDIAKFIDKYVGVYGKVVYDPTININIIKATDLKILTFPADDKNKGH